MLVGLASRATVAGKVFNVATQQQTSLLELVSQIQRLLAIAIVTEFKPAAIGILNTR
jgi:hypothetical protein